MKKLKWILLNVYFWATILVPFVIIPIILLGITLDTILYGTLHHNGYLLLCGFFNLIAIFILLWDFINENDIDKTPVVIIVLMQIIFYLGFRINNHITEYLISLGFFCGVVFGIGLKK